MQPTQSPRVDATRPNTATMGNFNDQPAMDMLPDGSFDGAFDEAGEEYIHLLRRRNVLLVGAAALIFWGAVIALALAIF